MKHTNEKLRDHNEELQVNLEQSNHALKRVVQQLDEMRAGRMFRVLQKMEYMTKVEAFYAFKANEMADELSDEELV